MHMRDRWMWIALAVLATLVIISMITGCGDLMQAGGHVFKAGGDTMNAIGEHLRETGQ